MGMENLLDRSHERSRRLRDDAERAALREKMFELLREELAEYAATGGVESRRDLIRTVAAAIHADAACHVTRGDGSVSVAPVGSFA